MDVGTAVLNLRSRDLEKAASRLLTWLVILAVAVVPLLIDLSNLDDTYYAGKARALAILTPVILAGLLASRGFSVLRQAKLFGPLMAFVTAVALATIVSVNPAWSLVGAPRRHEGLLSLLAYAVLCAGTLVVVARGGLTIWLTAVLAGGTLAGIYGIAQYFGFELIVRDSVRVDWWRPFSTSGNPNFLGAYMVLIAPLAMAVLLTARRRSMAVLSLGALAVSVLTAFCTYSRAAWLGLAVAAAVFVGLSARRLTRADAQGPWRRLAGACAIVVVLAGMFFASHSPLGASRADWSAAQRAWTAIEPSDPQGGFRWRLYFWRHTLQLLAKRPVLGYGPESLALVFPQGWDAERTRLFGDMMFTPPKVDKAHNETLDMAMSTGVLGVAAFWWVLISAVRAGKAALGASGSQWALAAACLASMAGYWVDVQWHFSVVSVAPVFWSVMGAAGGISVSPRGPNPIPLSLEGEGRVRGPEELL